MSYKKEDIVKIKTQYNNTKKVCQSLLINLARLNLKLKNKKSSEYLMHGVGRRLRILTRCIHNIFEIFPLEKKDLLTQEALSDIDINMHAHFVAIAGILDNLAWVFVFEKNLLKDDKVKRHEIGLFKKETQMHLNSQLKEYLSSEHIIRWNSKYFKVYRDTLVHRIPLYVPPYAVAKEDEKEDIELEKQLLGSEPIETSLLSQIYIKQEQLRKPCLFFKHSLDEDRAAMVLHAQVLADFSTVEEIINKFCSMAFE
jgi:hypothetical protein